MSEQSQVDDCDPTKSTRDLLGITGSQWQAIISRQVDIASGGDPDAGPKDSVLAFKALLEAMQGVAVGVKRERRTTTVNIGAVVNADTGTNRGIELLERVRASGVLGGADTRAVEVIEASD